MPPAVFLDRDNTLILNDGDLGDPDLVRLVEGVPAGLKALREAGYHLVVVTNQAGVARGRFNEEDVDAVHQRIAMLADTQARSVGLIDRFYYCPYHPEGTVAEYRRDHPWRKPHPGMILQAARDMAIELGRSWVIGDQERDILAGRAAGCRTILVTRDAELAQRVGPTEVAATFADATKVILRQAASQKRESGNGAAAPALPAQTTTHLGPSSPPQGRSNQSSVSSTDHASPDAAAIRRSISELAEEIRSDRVRRGEFTLARMTAGVCQLFAMLLALLGLLQLDNLEVFAKWMIGAALVQLVTITLLVLDLKA